MNAVIASLYTVWTKILLKLAYVHNTIMQCRTYTCHLMIKWLLFIHLFIYITEC
jgi:hypothetical protein